MKLSFVLFYPLTFLSDNITEFYLSEFSNDFRIIKSGVKLVKDQESFDVQSFCVFVFVCVCVQWFPKDRILIDQLHSA